MIRMALAWGLLTLAGETAAQGDAPRTVSVGASQVEEAGVVTAIEIDDASGLIAGDVDLLLDAASSEVVEVRRGAILDGFFLISNTIADTLKVSFASAQETTGAGTLFEVVTAAEPSPAMRLLLVSLNGDEIDVVYDRVTAVGEGDRPTPIRSLRGHPNPFNSQTVLTFTVTRPGPLMLSVFSVGRQRIRTLAHGDLPRGTHRFVWDGYDDDGREAASGVYLAQLRAGHRRDVVRLTLLR
jgi:hypothetical protein